MTRRYSPAALLASLILAASLCGCSLPRITVHDDPLTPEEHLGLGVSYEEKGELEQAKRQYRQATELPEAWLLLGNVSFRMERWEEAERHYKRAIRELPDDPRPLNNLAWLYYTRKKHLARAEELAQEAVSLAQDGDDAQYRDTLDSIRRLRQSGPNG